MPSLYYAVAAVTWISAVLGLVYALWAVRKSSGPARTSALCTLACGLALRSWPARLSCTARQRF